LLYAFPLLFLGSHTASYSETARIAGWAFAIWGTALYWLAAVLYLEQARRLIREDRPGGRPGPVLQAGPGEDREAGQR
jgi:cardiolipin synthase (CMP-forming)